MNHLAATHRGSSPGAAYMQMSTHLFEPAPIMSRKIETKTVHYIIGTRTNVRAHTGLQGIL